MTATESQAIPSPVMSLELAAMIGTRTVERHQGQRPYAPQQQAGHMTGAANVNQNEK
jgi:3-mercaptopyruvate sulfurtransferase SseA